MFKTHVNNQLTSPIEKILCKIKKVDYKYVSLRIFTLLILLERKYNNTNIYKIG